MNDLIQEFHIAPHLTHERNGGSSIPSTGHNRARYSTRQPVEVTIIGDQNPMPRRFDYDAHTWECGGVMAVGAPLHNPRAVLRRQQRIRDMGQIALGMAVFGFSAGLAIGALALLIRGIAAIGG